MTRVLGARRSRVAVWVVVPLVAAACVSGRPFGRESHPREAARGGTKYVAAKRDPLTLIAGDQTQCVVTRERFGTINVGDRVYCDWQ